MRFRQLRAAAGTHYRRAIILCGLWLSVLAGAGPADGQQQESDLAIINAFQERYHASTGNYYNWGPGRDGQSHTWLAPGDYSQPAMDDIIGGIIYYYLQRHTGTDWGVPLYYLSDDEVAGGKSWADIQKGIVRIADTGPPAIFPTLAERRRLIAAVLRQQRVLVTPLLLTNREMKRTELYAGSGGPANVTQAAARYDATPWVPQSASSRAEWHFRAQPGGGNFFTRIEVSRCRLEVAERLRDFRWVPVLAMPSLYHNWPESDPDYSRVIGALDAKGFYLSRNQGFFKYEGRDFDPGNLFAACAATCSVFSYINIDFRNVSSDVFSFALVYPSFKYLPSPAADSCCDSCTAGASEVRLKSVHIRMLLGKSRMGGAEAALSLDSPHVSTELFHPRSLQVQLAPGFSAVRDPAGVLQQVHGPAVIAAVLPRPAQDGYEVLIYDRSSGRQPDAATGLIDVSGLTPLTTERILNPLTGPGPFPPGVGELRHEKVHGTETEVCLFKSETQAGHGTPVTSLTFPGGHRKESVRTIWSVNANGDRLPEETATRLTYDADSALTGHDVQVFRRGVNGRLLEKMIVDAGGASLTASYTYAGDDPERLSQAVRPDGSWDQYSYDTLRRLTKHRSGKLDAPLTCTDAECRVETITWPNGVGNVRRTVVTHGGVEVARRYWQDLSDGYRDEVCTVAGAAMGDTTNLVTATQWVPAGWFARKPQTVTASDGTVTIYKYSTSPANVDPADADTVTIVIDAGFAGGGKITDGIRTTRITNSQGTLIAEAAQDIKTGEILSSRLAGDYDAFGRPLEWSYHDGTAELLNYDCCGLASRTDRQGVTTNYTRARVVNRVPAAGGAALPALESSTWQIISWADAGGVLRTGILEHIQREEGLTSRTFRKGADGSQVETSRTVRDLSGRVVASRDAAGHETTFSEHEVPQGPPPAEGQPDTRAKHRIRTATFPNGGTRIEEYAMDGSLLRLSGTAVRAQRYEYGADAAGTWTKSILLHMDGSDSGEWTQSWSDMAGRPWKSLTSSGAVSTKHFNAAGQLAKTVDPDGVTTLFSYDPRGRLWRRTLDVDRSGTVNQGDRITQTETSVASRDGEPVHRSVTKVHSMPRRTFLPEFSREEIHISGLESWSTAASLTTHTQRSVPAAGAWTESVTHTDRTTAVRTFAGGRLASEMKKSAGGDTLSVISYSYDAHGRLRFLTDARGGVTRYTYHAGDRVHTVTSPDPDGNGPLPPPVTITTWTVMGQQDDVTLPDGRTSQAAYDLTGDLLRTGGSAAPAVALNYDYAGRLSTLTTQPGTAAAAVTAWNYFADSGLLQSKVHPAGSGTLSYTWTPGGRPATRTNGRGILTSYTYDLPGAAPGVVSAAGDIVKVSYSDPGTPEVTYAYDSLGRMLSATRDGIARTVDLSLEGQQESESWSGGPLGGLTVDPGFDGLRRRNALAVSGPDAALPPEQTYAFHPDTGELDRLTTSGPGLSGAAAIAYNYRSGTRQIESLTFSEGGVQRLAHQRAYDDLHRLTGITAQTAGAGILTTSQYTLDALGRRDRTALGDGTWWQYTYDNYGQVRAAARRFTAGAAPAESDPVLPGQQFTYAYDGAGNRTAISQGGGGINDSADTTWAPANAANQYTSVASDRSGTALGIAAAGATVTVNGTPAARQDQWWAMNAAAAPGSAAALIDFNIEATLDGQTTQATSTILAPPASVIHQYDADGNLTGDGLRTFTWDAENRLTSVTTNDDLLPQNAPHYRVTYQYDDLSRRIAQTTESRTENGDLWITARRRAFLYDGWHCIAEFDYTLTENTASRTLFRSTLWSPENAPLVIRRHTGASVGTHFATTDGNANVTALTDAAAGHESARYDYDPFGNLLRATGPFAAENPLRFSSQHADDITGLYYYGYRHYDPAAGRWLSRDPIGEFGGLNLYGFLENDSVNGVDLLGLVLYAFDGTGNDRVAEKWGGSTENAPTNVAIMYDLYNGERRYQNGVGTRTDVFYGKLFGTGMQERLDLMMADFDAYYSNFSSDPIDIIGFSRGAAAARYFANMIHKKYPCAKIRFMGIFDTVAQDGAPDAVNFNSGRSLDIPRNVEYVAHAVARDEHRHLFPLSSISRSYTQTTPELRAVLQNYATIAYHPEEIVMRAGKRFWEQPFSGSHSDIGGGYHDGRNIEALRWMFNIAISRGVPLKPRETYPALQLGLIYNPEVWHNPAQEEALYMFFDFHKADRVIFQGNMK